MLEGHSDYAPFRESFVPTNMPSGVPKENADGVIKDIRLIALGANKTLSVPRVLVEYAFIYEPKVSPKNFTETSFIMAEQTVKGIREYTQNH